MLLFASTILLSAFLLFLVQPIIAKQILPWFGGTSAVWTTCMVFFQVLLLAGYAYSHLVTRRLAPRAQTSLHIALLAASLAFLPIVPRETLKPVGEQDAALAIIVVLAATIGLPYLLLATTGPLVQKWVAHRFAEKTVYRLFALSNFGSLVGLLAFPFAIEPFADSVVQSYAWSGAYALFVAACAATAWQSRDRPTAPYEFAADSPAAVDAAGVTPHATTTATEHRPGVGDYALWLALSALGSVMLLAATSHITQNIASVPFLWVLPLVLYLLSFVIVFEGRGGRGWYERDWLLLPALMLVVAMAWGLAAERGVLDVSIAIPLYCAGVFVACLFCHGELALRKPAPRYLTHFYLSLSLGGALGGLAVGLAAPRVFPAYFELPLALFALAALAVYLVLDNRTLVGPALVATAATGYFGWSYVEFLRNDVIVMQRNFYGMLRVREQGSGADQVRRLLHGVILHGEQPTHGADRLEPGTYYARTSGVGLAIAAKQARGPVRLGVIGLGIGTLSAYGRAGDVIRFYELDPDVLRLARSHFSYLDATPARLEFVLGDARLSMERELAAGRPQRFDVLAIDAFSSDSIPVHLITREAIAAAARHVAPDGIIAVHISNRFLDLKPVLANIAQAEGLTAKLVSDEPEGGGSASTTDWVLLARDPRAFDDATLAERAEDIAPNPAYSLWTDRFNNLLDVLKSRPLENLKSMLSMRWPQPASD
ncbi:MAG: fused MFS/spermidine synthase [Burkholderiaceae bacterium]